MRPIVVFILLVMIGVVGCAKGAPTADDLRGTWVITKESRELLPVAARKDDGKLVLRQSGEFVANRIPGDLLYAPPGVDNALPVSGTGTWKFHDVDGSTVLLLTFNAITSPEGYKVPTGAQFSIDNNWHETVLYFFLGDPDDGKRVDFTKVK